MRPSTTACGRRARVSWVVRPGWGTSWRIGGLWAVLWPWTIVLVLDFIISFSYSLSPRNG